ncbi:MAG: DUF1842 domain-containing protein [Pelagimonas sp.]|uniref:DUF1842 domain-containing protein n=1 Tax=Pelagimonas sp. TaxID=2073170 RepID=UPI003D6BF9A7
MDTKVETGETGLFLVNYRVSNGMAGAPVLTLALTVSTPNRMVSGIAHVTQALQHPNVATAQVTGSYHEYSDVNGPNYVISLDGYAPVVVNNDARPILEAELVLVGGWESGTGSFSFRRAPQGPMTHITDAAVEMTSKA